MTSLVITAATEGDLDALAALEAVAFPTAYGRAAFAAELTRPLARLDVARRGDAVVGYTSAWLVGDELHLHAIATAPAARRGGVAAALLGHLLAVGHAGGARVCTLEVRRGNVAAIALYRRFGFAVVHTRDGEDGLVMAAAVEPTPGPATGSSP
jgi:ribosomal-protein-alanine N-acetyltransferase